MLWDFFLSTQMSTTLSSTQSTRNKILGIFFSQSLAFKFHIFCLGNKGLKKINIGYSWVE